MITCWDCGEEVDSARFCTQCGSPLKAVPLYRAWLQAAAKERNIRENAPPELLAEGMAEVEDEEVIKEVLDFAEEDDDLDDRAVLTGKDLIEKYLADGGALNDTVNDFDNWLRGPSGSR